VRAELEDAQLGGGLDGVERAVHLLGVDAVANPVEELGHGSAGNPAAVISR
jgi:hypothetical protein